MTDRHPDEKDPLIAKCISEGQAAFSLAMASEDKVVPEEAKAFIDSAIAAGVAGAIYVLFPSDDDTT